MIRIDLDDVPAAVLILTPCRLGWHAEARPIQGAFIGPPQLPVWRLSKFAAAAAAVRDLIDRRP